MKYTIEKDVPLPEDWESKVFSGNRDRYSFMKQMEIGDSFTVNVSATTKEQNEFAYLRAKITKFSKDSRGVYNYAIRLVTRDLATGMCVYRVWRSPNPMQSKIAKLKRAS